MAHHNGGMSSFPVHIEPTDSAPPFEQLRAGVIAAIADGTLSPGTRLPTVRALAAELSIAAGTVARAYRELEAAGVIETRGRAGTFVNLDTDPTRRQAQSAAAEFAVRVRALGIDDAEARSLVDEALRAHG